MRVEACLIDFSSEGGSLLTLALTPMMTRIYRNEKQVTVDKIIKALQLTKAGVLGLAG